MPSDVLPPARHYPHEVPQSSQTVPPTRDQGLRYLSLWGIFSFKPPQVRLKLKVNPSIAQVPCPQCRCKGHSCSGQQGAVPLLVAKKYSERSAD